MRATDMDRLFTGPDTCRLHVTSPDGRVTLSAIRCGPSRPAWQSCYSDRDGSTAEVAVFVTGGEIDPVGYVPASRLRAVVGLVTKPTGADTKLSPSELARRARSLLGGDL